MPKMTTKLWCHSLIAAAIGGAANSITVVIVDPLNFNLGNGLGKLASVAAISALVSIALFLKQSPLPDTVETLTITETHQVSAKVSSEEPTE